MYLCFFFFKQKTAYEMRISDWSSDVCSSDLELKSITKKLSKDTILIEKLRDILEETSTFIPYCVTYDLCQVTKVLNDGNYDNDDLETSGLILSTNQIFGNSGTNF